MGKETERKFLVKNDSWRDLAEPVRYIQGYLSVDPDRVVRVRLAGNEAFLTVKGPAICATRSEYEYLIPAADAMEMLQQLCLHPIIDKHRYIIHHQGMIWEVDVFFGENLGLVVAEIELRNEDQFFEKPEWIGEEVTGDARYSNASLVNNPYSKWKVE